MTPKVNQENLMFLNFPSEVHSDYTMVSYFKKGKRELNGTNVLSCPQAGYICFSPTRRLSL